MKTTTNKPLVIALFLLFSGGAMSGEMMKGGMHGSGWTTENDKSGNSESESRATAELKKKLNN